MLYLCVLQQLVRCGVSCMNSASVERIEVVLGSIRVQGGGKRVEGREVLWKVYLGFANCFFNARVSFLSNPNTLLSSNMKPSR